VTGRGIRGDCFFDYKENYKGQITFFSLEVFDQLCDALAVRNCWRTMAKVPARTAESDAMSRDLLRRGFKFAGSTICCALMQATGMVNDHLVACPRHAELGGKRSPAGRR
jgi:3-methyladenine DNA glycosylase Tag